MNRYELMYILDTALEGEPRNELIGKFGKLLTDNGAEIEKVEEWGKRRLAYPINFKNEGYYVLVTFKADPTVPREIERNLRISDQVMRSMVVRLEEKHTSVKPRRIPERQVAPPAEPKVEPEEPAVPVAAQAEVAPEAAAAPQVTEQTTEPVAAE